MIHNSAESLRASAFLSIATAVVFSLLSPGPRLPQRSASANPKPWGLVQFGSSDRTLAAGFDWAKQQALTYVFTGDPVGNWYEAALPGRSAFCMRDVSHQSIGAQVLGLAEFNRNMLKKFAASIAASRGWAGYWEINKYDQPAPVDYKNDQDFWFNLPANFDVVNTCYQVYRWTGDDTYLNDSVFLNFYERTLNDYIHHWDKDGVGIPESFPEYGHRGLGSYDENPNLHIKIGGDLMAAEYAAYMAYANIAVLRKDSATARALREKAAALRKRFNDDWWDWRRQVFNTALLSDDKFYFGSSDAFMPLWFGLIEPGDRLQHELGLVTGLRSAGALLAERQDVRDAQETEAELATQLARAGVEEMSYVPEIAYRYGRDDRGYAVLVALMDPGLRRREYPEVSFSVIRTIAVGLMGIDPDPAERLLATRSHLTKRTAWAKLEDVPVFNNRIAVSHSGVSESTLINEEGPRIQWKAEFPGSIPKLLVDGKAKPAEAELDAAGDTESYVIVAVSSGRKVTVRTLSHAANR